MCAFVATILSTAISAAGAIQQANAQADAANYRGEGSGEQRQDCRI